MAWAFAVRAGACAVFVTLTCTVAATQQSTSPARTQQTPSRDTRAPAAIGRGIIRGRVHSVDGNRPLRRVQIKATAPELGGQPRTTSTDESGEYELTELPPGRYTVTAARGGFLTLSYGQRRPRELGRIIEVTGTPPIVNIDFALPKMSLISGRVTDEDGDPIAGVNVLALRSIYIVGQRQLVPVGDTSVRTDDVGEFRIGDLIPGTYVVSARSAEKWSVISGTEETMGYAPTYFPGTTNSVDARRIVLGLGQEASATDFSLIPGRAVTVSGTALDSLGQPFDSVRLSVEVRSEGGGAFSSAGQAPVARDGTFVFRDIAPGTYVLRAGRQDANPELARLPITVDGIDLTNIVLTGSAGGTVSGRVVLDEGVTAQMPSVQIAITERIIGQPDPGMLGTFRGRYVPVVPSPTDGSFVVSHVFGPAPLTVTLPDGWIVKAVMKDGHEVTDAPIELRNGEQLADLQIVLTNRVTRISGTLTDERGSPRGDGTIIVHSADRQKWFEGSRYVRTARPDQTGRYQINGLPPGQYLAVGLDYVEVGAWNEPEYLDSIQRHTEKITVDENQPLALSLKLVTVQ